MRQIIERLIESTHLLDGNEVLFGVSIFGLFVVASGIFVVYLFTNDR